MKLGIKTMLTLGMIMALLFALLYIISTRVVRKGYAQLERQYTLQNVDRVKRAVEGREEELGGK